MCGLFIGMKNMPVPASIDDLSTTPGSNSPAGSESPGLIDDYLRTISAFVAQLRDADAVLRTADRAISSHGVRMSVPTASVTATLAADEIVCKGTGVSWILSAFSKTINLSTTGAGGMDTGAAPVSGYVALYAIYNPTTLTSALLAKNATLAAQTETYTGANMPSGYTASALLTVVPTDGSSLFAPCWVFGDYVGTPLTSAYTSATPQTTLTLRSIATVVPLNAKFADISTAMNSTSASVTLTSGIAGSSAAAGAIGFKINACTSGAVGGSGAQWQFSRTPLITPQTVYYSVTVGTGALSFSISVNGYYIR